MGIGPDPIDLHRRGIRIEQHGALIPVLGHGVVDRVAVFAQVDGEHGRPALFATLPQTR